MVANQPGSGSSSLEAIRFEDFRVLDIELLLVLADIRELTTSQLARIVGVPSPKAYSRCHRLEDRFGFLSSRPGPALHFFYPSSEVVTAANRDRIMRQVERRKAQGLDPGLRALATRQRCWKLGPGGRTLLAGLRELLCSGAAAELPEETVH